MIRFLVCGCGSDYNHVFTTLESFRNVSPSASCLVTSDDRGSEPPIEQ